jgi:hypothetical protein
VSDDLKRTMLALGSRGRYEGASFVLAERALLRSSAGGIWNEWRCAFDDGRVAFLAEERGTFAIYFESSLVSDPKSLTVGGRLDLDWVVVERDTAAVAQIFGDSNRARDSYTYVDLSSPSGSLATIDYSESIPRIFVGIRVRLASLSLDRRSDRPTVFTAADLPPPKDFELFLSLGDSGSWDGMSIEVLGAMERSVSEDGERFSWGEYLIWNVDKGFHWLAVSDGHWTFVEPIDAGKVHASADSATFEGETFRAFSSGEARVDYAVGEFPWDVSVGETSRVRDFVSAPYMLSLEASDTEVAWSRGTYAPPEAIARAFGDRALPKPHGRAPHQPRTIRTMSKAGEKRR